MSKPRAWLTTSGTSTPPPGLEEQGEQKQRAHGHKQKRTPTHARTHPCAHRLPSLASLKAGAADAHSVAQGSQRPCCLRGFVSLSPGANA